MSGSALRVGEKTKRKFHMSTQPKEITLERARRVSHSRIGPNSMLEVSCLIGLPRGKVSGVYLITSLATGKKYVGASSDIRRRARHHRSLLGRGAHGNVGLRRESLVKAARFTFSILELISPSSLEVRELFHIEEQNSAHPKGYNLMPKGYDLMVQLLGETP